MKKQVVVLTSFLEHHNKILEKSRTAPQIFSVPLASKTTPPKLCIMKLKHKHFSYPIDTCVSVTLRVTGVPCFCFALLASSSYTGAGKEEGAAVGRRRGREAEGCRWVLSKFGLCSPVLNRNV